MLAMPRRKETVRELDRQEAWSAARYAPDSAWHPTPPASHLGWDRKARLRVCAGCGGRFIGRAGQEYGSGACRQRAYRRRLRTAAGR
jgi:hypothetical protein